MSRTVIASIVSIVVGLMTVFGVTIPADFAADLSKNIDVVIGGLMAIYGALMWVFRAITSSPLLNLFKKDV